jgi:hypothetical protein
VILHRQQERRFMEYVDISPELMGQADPDQQWIERQLDRIAPWRGEQGHDGADTAALRKLVLELRQQRENFVQALDECESFCIGMQLDPSIPKYAKEALHSRASKTRAVLDENGGAA